MEGWAGRDADRSLLLIQLLMPVGKNPVAEKRTILVQVVVKLAENRECVTQLLLRNKSREESLVTAAGLIVLLGDTPWGSRNQPSPKCVPRTHN